MLASHKKLSGVGLQFALLDHSYSSETRKAKCVRVLTLQEKVSGVGLSTQPSCSVTRPSGILNSITLSDLGIKQKSAYLA